MPWRGVPRGPGPQAAGSKRPRGEGREQGLELRPLLAGVEPGHRGEQAVEAAAGVGEDAR